MIQDFFKSSSGVRVEASATVSENVKVAANRPLIEK